MDRSELACKEAFFQRLPDLVNDIQKGDFRPLVRAGLDFQHPAKLVGIECWGLFQKHGQPPLNALPVKVGMGLNRRRDADAIEFLRARVEHQRGIVEDFDSALFEFPFRDLFRVGVGISAAGGHELAKPLGFKHEDGAVVLGGPSAHADDRNANRRRDRLHRLPPLTSSIIARMFGTGVPAWTLWQEQQM